MVAGDFKWRLSSPARGKWQLPPHFSGLTATWAGCDILEQAGVMIVGVSCNVASHVTSRRQVGSIHSLWLSDLARPDGAACESEKAADVGDAGGISAALSSVRLRKVTRFSHKLLTHNRTYMAWDAVSLMVGELVHAAPSIIQPFLVRFGEH